MIQSDQSDRSDRKERAERGAGPSNRLLGIIFDT